MNWYFISAGTLTVAIGIVHSVLGERLIFRRMRSAGFIPTNGGQVLREPHVRILWASWHVATVMALCIATVLFWLALPSSRSEPQFLVAMASIAAMLANSMLVLVGTNGWHPGWAGMLGVRQQRVIKHRRVQAHRPGVVRVEAEQRQIAPHTMAHFCTRSMQK